MTILTHALDLTYADGAVNRELFPSEGLAVAAFDAARSSPLSEVTGGEITELDEPIESPATLALVPDMAAEVAAMKAAQALRILETLNAARMPLTVLPPGTPEGRWLVRNPNDPELTCHGATLTDALAQFATAVGLE